MALNLVYALKGGKLVHISEVERGMACGCICPGCGAELIARKGDRVTHHFAHYNGALCQYGYETSLHMAAKKILSEERTFTIPPVYIEFSEGYKVIKYSDSKQIVIDDVKLESHMGDIIPDVIIYSGGKKFIVEIFVTHPINAEKLKRIKQHNISIIEIDLSHKKEIVSDKELRDVLLKDSKLKTWKYNTVTKSIQERFIKVADFKPQIHRGVAIHIDYCPIEVRLWKGKSYANFIDDCIGCEFFLMEKDNGIFCTGRLGYAECEDFKLSYDERKKKYNIKQMGRQERILKGICPDCGRKITLRKGRKGYFYGCSGYPRCKWKMNFNPETGEIFI